MKVLAWFIAPIGAGFLIEHLASRYVSHSNANGDAALSAAAQTTNAPNIDPTSPTP